MRLLPKVLADHLAQEQERWFPWCVVFFGGGIVTYFGLKVEPTFAVAAAVGLTAGLFALFATRCRGIGIRFLCALIAASGLGFSAAKLRAVRVDAPIVQRDTGPVKIAGRIEDVEVRALNRARIVLALSAMEHQGAPPHRVRLTVMGTKAVQAAVPGASISALAVLRPPPEPALPGGYDFARWAYFQGIGAVGFTYGAPQLVEGASPHLPTGLPPASFRSGFQ